MEYYDKLSQGYDLLYGEEQLIKWGEIKHLIRKGKVLDVGCGTGLITEKLKGFIVGVDLSIKMLKIAKKRGINNLVLAKAEMLPFKNQVFDQAVSITVFQDIPSLEDAVKEIRRVSKEAIITILNKRRIKKAERIIGEGRGIHKDKLFHL